jgi:hypothetical protein
MWSSLSFLIIPDCSLTPPHLGHAMIVEVVHCRFGLMDVSGDATKHREAGKSTSKRMSDEVLC